MVTSVSCCYYAIPSVSLMCVHFRYSIDMATQSFIMNVLCINDVRVVSPVYVVEWL